MSEPRVFQKASEEYDKDKETEFRETLRRYLEIIGYEVDNLRRGRDVNLSLYSNREALKFPPLGVTDI